MARSPKISTPPAPIDPLAAIAQVARALGHPARLRIVELLLLRRICVGGELVGELGLAQSTVSEHLRILKEAGLVCGEIERPRVCYSLSTLGLDLLSGWLQPVVEQLRQQGAPCAVDGDCIAKDVTQ